MHRARRRQNQEGRGQVRRGPVERNGPGSARHQKHLMQITMAMRPDFPVGRTAALFQHLEMQKIGLGPLGRFSVEIVVWNGVVAHARLP